MATATPAQVRAAAREWLDAPHYTMIVRPYPQLAPGADRRSTARCCRRSAPRPTLRFPAVQRATLSNGLKVVLLERHGDAARQRRARRRRRLRRRRPGQGRARRRSPSTCSTTARRRATRSASSTSSMRSARELVDRAARSTCPSCASARCRRTSARRSQIIADVVLNPAFPPDMVDAAQKRRRSRRSARRRRSRGARRCGSLPRLLYGDGARLRQARSPGSGTRRRSRRSPATTCWRGTARGSIPNSSTLIVTGDVTLAQLEPGSRAGVRRLAGGRGAGEDDRRRAARTTGGKRLPDRQARRAAVGDRRRARHRARRAAEDLAIETVMRNFGGMATSRLNRNLRLDKHWSYGTQAALLDRRAGRVPSTSSRRCRPTRRRSRWSRWRRRSAASPASVRSPARSSRASCATQTLGLPGRFETLDALETRRDRDRQLRLSRRLLRDVRRQRPRAGREARWPTRRANSSGPDEVIWLVVGDLRRSRPASAS